MGSLRPRGAPSKTRRVELVTIIPNRRGLTLCLFAAGLLVAACQGRGLPAVGGPFQLVDQDGHRQDQSILKGKWSVVFFGYTFCPDVCPATLQVLGEAQDRLGPKAARLQVVFITVDPERDTPFQLKRYLSSSAFPKGTIGLTGSPAEVARAAKAYHVFYQKQGTGQDYAMEHSSAVYLMAPNGRFNRVVAYGLTPEEVARQISEAMREG
jgi:protein SCO1/2